MHKTHPTHASRAARVRHVLPLLAAGILLSACGLIGGSDEYVIGVDSVSFAAPMLPDGAVRTTYHGFVGANGCATLRRVERQALPADTLQLRFIGRTDGGNCTQMPIVLRHVDSIPNLPARTVHLRVLQRSGDPLRYNVTLPLAATP